MERGKLAVGAPAVSLRSAKIGPGREVQHFSAPERRLTGRCGADESALLVGVVRR